MIQTIRKILWRVLGFDYGILLKKTDYVLLGNDKFAKLGLKTYENGAKVWRWTKAPLNIGNYCSIAHNVNFIVDEGFHQASEITNYPFVNNLTTRADLLYLKSNIKQKQGITIGHDVWIGLNAIILPGVVIGNGATIAANTVVNKNVPNYSIVAGNPGAVVKMKHDKITIQKLQDIAWWNWPMQTIENRRESFYLPLDEFIQKYSSRK